MNINISKIEEFRNLLAESRNIVIVGHTNPDGDAIGSSLALAEVLTARGHNVTCTLPNNYPYYLRWIPYYKQTNNSNCKATSKNKS